MPASLTNPDFFYLCIPDNNIQDNLEAEMYLKQIVLQISVCLFFSLSVYGQVTIGSNNAPSMGSLLDLKENNNQGANASKGLALPRVVLTNLKPANPAQLAGSIGSTGSWSLEEHIGLLIYNVKQDMCASEPIFEGMHVWDGAEWQLLNAKNPNVHIFTDPRDGETYTYRRFGDAGIWMTQHMRAIKYADGTSIDEYDGSTTTSPDKGMYAYPLASVSSWGVKPSRWKKEYGVFYNFPAATKGYLGKGSNDQSQSATPGIIGLNEVENDTSLPVDYHDRHIVQGICPNGWHVPSDREWNELEKEIYQNAELYSSYTRDEVVAWNAAIPWDPEWESHASVKNRPAASNVNAHGAAMMTKCPFEDVITSGKSKSSWEGGFDVPLIGHIYNNFLTSPGSAGRIMSASILANQYNRTRAWFNNDNSVQRGSSYKSVLIPVRCKKNDLNL